MKKAIGMIAAVLAVQVFAAEEAADKHVDAVVSSIKESVAKLKAAKPDAVPMAFWDFDGTIIDGDVTEGLERDGRQVYKGLAEESILGGMNKVYKGEAGRKQYFEIDYPRMNQIGRWFAWPFNAQMFEGVPVAELDAFCEKKYESVYQHYYFDSSVKMLKALEAAGVENYIVSASPECFVGGAAKSLGLGRQRFRAIRVKVVGGRYTTDLVYPIPAGEGKVENVRDLVLARGNGVAVAGFGNSYSTDGPFLRYIVTQHLLGGARPFALMINGGKPPAGYEGLFTCVEQRATVR